MNRFSLLTRFGLGRSGPRLARRPKLVLGVLEERAVPATLHVGANETYHTIQAAVNAAGANDTIKIDAGTYTEQVSIGSGKNGLKLVGAGTNATVVRGPGTLTGNDAIIEVNGAQNVQISGLTVKGPATTNGTLSLYGVLVDGGGSATVTGDRITGIEDAPLDGNQKGFAVEVGLAGSTPTTGNATIVNDAIDNYQKGGINVENAGSNAVIEFDSITGVGPTSLIAQNGITVINGATADIEGNTVTGNVYIGSSGDGSTGILLANAGHVLVIGNAVNRNDYGIYDLSSNGALIALNTASRDTYNGIVLDTVSNVAVTLNTTDFDGSGNTGDGGIALFSATNNSVKLNVSAINNGSGIYVDPSSTGNSIALNLLFANAS